MRILFSLVAFICVLTVNAQNYLISFTGLGGSSTVSSVKVENLTQGTAKTLTGNDILHLVGTITGIDPIIKQPSNQIRFFPNPMVDYTNLQFDMPKSGKVVVSLHDISGKVIMQTQDNLLRGQHTYKIQGIDKGVYLVTIKTSGFILTGKILSQGLRGSSSKIICLNSVPTQEEKTGRDLNSKEKESSSKGVASEIEMQYTTGDRLKLIGTSGIYSTVIVDVPTESKTIIFSFIPCTDGDGNNYPIVQIGNQLWMAENLKTTKYNNGTAIPAVTDATVWQELGTPGYCWYNNDSATYKSTYGAIYKWFVVNATSNGGKNVCPTGWHVPSDAEWTTMESYMIANGYNYDGSTTGNKIAKSLAVTSGWPSFSQVGTIGNNKLINNGSGFSALPSGRRGMVGTFWEVGEGGYWWSTTEHIDNAFAYLRSLYYYSSNLERGYIHKTYGFSIRCIRD
jgi:uncharacterized protein (TIGR02145 family)